jgi:cGMP-dependent protein kinase
MGNLCIKGDEITLNDAAGVDKSRPSHALLTASGMSAISQQAEATFKAKRNRANVHTAAVNLNAPPSHKKVPKTAAQEGVIRTALASNFLFSGISEADVDVFCDSAQVSKVAAGVEIIREGDEGNYFYIVEEGSFSVSIRGNAQPNAISNGGCFGELALLYDMPRAATVKATRASSVFIIERDTFRYIIANAAASKHKAAVSILSKVSILDGLNEEQLDDLANSVEVATFPANAVVFTKGSIGNIFYMIQQGTVQLSDFGGNFNDLTLTAGQHFGERALLTGEPRSGTAKSMESCQLMMIDRELFEKKLGPIREVLARNLAMIALTSSKLFANLTDKEKMALKMKFECSNYNTGENIVTVGDHGDKFFVLYEGNATVKDGEGKKLKDLKTGDFFGETALMNDSDVRTATVTAVSKCVCYSIERTTFRLILSHIKEKLEKEAKYRVAAKGTGADDAVYKAMKMSDLKRVAILGSGTFGRVTLEKTAIKGETRYFALKAMIKSELVAQKQQTNVMNEKNLMMECHHPFILRLFTTFKDAKRLYMLLEFIQGGELFTVVHTPQRDGVPMVDARFYSAGVLLGMSYMHSKDIAYRDMKPENCLIDAQGYPKIVDFGFAKVIKKKSYTLCGTPEYLAPELVLGRGHGKAVDLWAFGILTYELAVGYSPFCDPRNMDQTTICRNIVNGKLVFPKEGFGRKGTFDKDCKDFVSKLLVRQPDQRLGNRVGGADEMFEHPFFKSISFDAYMEKSIKAPWTPPLKSQGDVSHFEGIDDHVGDGPPYTDRTGWEKDF